MALYRRERPAPDGEDSNDSVKALSARLEAELYLTEIAERSRIDPIDQDPLADLRRRAWINSHLPIGWPRMPAGFWAKARAVAQKALRRLLHWYINPIVDQQNAFNASLVTALDDLCTRIAAVSTNAVSDSETSRQLLRRIATLQATSLSLATAAPSEGNSLGAALAADADLPLRPLGADYLRAFAERLALQQHLAPASPKTVLVMGLFAEPVRRLAFDLGIEVVTLDAAAAGSQQGDLTPVDDGSDRHPDAVCALHAVEPESLAGVIWAGGLWRVNAPQVTAVAQLLCGALAPGGLLWIESVVAADAAATARWVWSDIWARRPYTAELLATLLQAGGLSVADQALALCCPDGRPSGWFAQLAERGPH